MKHVILLLVLATAACSTTAVDLPYSPKTVPTVRGTPAITSVSVTDAREEKDPTYVGAVRGTVGNPVNTIVTKHPMAEEVQTAFEQALNARHLLGAPSRNTLSIQLTKLSANQTIVRTTNAAFRLDLRNASGRITYTDTVDLSKSSGYVFSARVSELYDLGVQTLTEAIDQALDKPAFLTALTAAP